jgi:L-iditol 2-dehydrogenase
MFDIPRTMTAAVMPRPLEMNLEELPVPEPGPRDVLVKVMAVGVCGSDVHYYEHGRIGPYVVQKPIILGHECAGIVVACGSDVTRVRPGDRVAVEPGVTCGVCEYCKAGRYNLCPDVRFLATPPVDGAFVQYICHREDFVFPIPESLSFEAAALVEPLSVGVHALKRAGFQPGWSVAVVGLGPVGLMAVVAAKLMGASRIVASDLEENRLRAAIRLGATEGVPASSPDAAREIRDRLGRGGADVALETAGHGKALQTALASVRRGGKLVIVGLPANPDVALNVPFICDNEVDIYGVFRYTNTYPLGIRLLSAGQVDLSPLLTHRFPLAETQRALETALHDKKNALKVMVYPNGQA